MRYICALILLASLCSAQTTPVYSLNVPTAGTETNLWGPLLNANMYTLEGILSGSAPLTALNVTGAVNAGSIAATGTVSGASVSAGTGNLTGNNLLGMGGAVPQALVPSAGVIAWNINSYFIANGYATLSQNTTLNLSNMISGATYQLTIYQPSSGSSTYSLTLGTGCTWKIANGGHGAVTLTPTIGAKDILVWFYSGTYCDGGLIPNLN